MALKITKQYKCENEHYFDVKYDGISQVEHKRPCPECGKDGFVVFQPSVSILRGPDFTQTYIGPRGKQK